jgi:hypothetical protein
MAIKRIPLFILGIIYGTLINSAVLGIMFGLCKALEAIIFVCQLAAKCDCGSIENDDEVTKGLMALAVIIAAVFIFAATFGGLLYGIGYALTKGTWHCAMDFYNHGLIKGLASPFKFLRASWNDMFKHDNALLIEYYKSTDISFLEKQRAAKQAIEDKAINIARIFDDLNKEKKLPELPRRLQQIILVYETTPHDIILPDRKGKTARLIENAESKTPQKKETAGDYFTDLKALDLIQKNKFFHESHGKKSIQEGKRPLRETRPFPC